MKLAINPDLINKNMFDNKRAMAHGFENVDISQTTLAQFINKGIAFCPQVRDGHRTGKNFICADYVAVDIDEGLTIDDALSMEFVKNYASILYKTPSHTDSDHRFRIIFETERTISDPNEMTNALRGLLLKLGGDPSAKDASRLFFGSKGSKPTVFGNTLPNTELDLLIQLGKEPERISDKSNGSGSVSLRANIRLPVGTMVRDANGNHRHLVDLPELTPVYCPVHNDLNPSAFTVISQGKSVGVHCATCRLTYWTEGGQPSEYDFYSYDKEVHECHEKENNNSNEYEENGLLFVHPRECQILDSEYLPQLPVTEGLTLIKSPKGTGKTEYLEGLIEECKKRKWRVLMVGHRQSLLKANAARLGMVSYLLDDGKHAYPSSLYAICVDSMSSLLTPTTDKYDVLVIDESEQVFAHLTSDTLKNRRRECYLILQHYIRNAKTIVALDADINTVTVGALALFGSAQSDMNLRFVLNEYRTKERQVSLYKTDKHLHAELISSVEKNHRVFVCCNSKARAETIVHSIQAVADKSTKIMLITSDNSKNPDILDFVTNIKTKILDYQVVVVSPAVGTGVDITFDRGSSKIDCVYGFFDGRINTHFDVDQQISRVRHPKQIKVWIDPRCFNFETNVNAIKIELAESNTVPEVLLGYHKDGRKHLNLDDPFLELYAQILSAQRASKNRLKQNWIDLRQRNGWKVIDVERDPASHQVGDEYLNEGDYLRKQELVKNLMDARQLDDDEYRFLYKQRENNALLAADQQWALRKGDIERFYHLTLSPELIGMDQEGRFRNRIAALERLIPSLDKFVKIREMFDALSPDVQGKKDDVELRTKLLGKIFQAANLLDMDGCWDTETVITAKRLENFVEVCKKNKPRIERLLKENVRRDIDEKPTSQLSRLLSIVGLSLENVGRTKLAGEVTYQYRLNQPLLESLEEIINRRHRQKNGKKIRLIQRKKRKN